MKIAIISDVHSNLEALTTVLAYCDSEGIDKIVCLGDVIGYGADPNPCCDLIRERVNVTLMGNHDAAVIGMMDTGYYYPIARQALFWTRKQLTEDNFNWLYGLPYTYETENIGFYHAAPIKPSDFHYLVSNDAAEHHLKMFDKLLPFNFVGHSHLTNQYLLSSRRVRDMTGQVATVESDKKWLINVGSVGQPRDRDNRSCFGVFDTTSQSFDHVRLEYNIQATADKIVEAGLDEKFAQRLFAGL